MPDQPMTSSADVVPPGALEPEAPLPAGLAAEFDGAPAEVPDAGAAEPPPEPVVSGEVLPAAEAPAPETSAAPAVIVAAAAGAPASGNGTAAVAAAAVSAEAGTEFQLSENVGLSLAAYQPAPELPADKALLRLLVPEQRLVDLWNQVDQLEIEAANLSRGSQKLVIELISRLAAARNMLLHHRDQYENAQREVTYVRYRLTRIRQSSLFEQPQSILVYLVLVLALIALGFATAPNILAGLGSPATIAGIESTTLLNTLLWGGVGGLTAAYFALQRHVEDFDQQHARWYYLGPIVGLFIGPLMALVASIGLPALFALASGDPADVAVRPFLLYLLAWAVGFQQNLLLKIVTVVFKRIFPAKPEA